MDIGSSLTVIDDIFIRTGTLLNIQHDPEQLDILRVKNQGRFIQGVANQTEAVQLAAIRQNVLAIQGIHDPTDPTDAVLQEALFRNVNVIWRPNQCFL